MPTVVADTGPLRYLVLIGAVDVLPTLFGRVLIPEIVGAELSQPATPLPVRQWLASAPAWLERRRDASALDQLPPRLDAGERAAIGLAQAIGNALLLIDDRSGIEAARSRGIDATGTLGVLVRGATWSRGFEGCLRAAEGNEFSISPRAARRPIGAA